MKLTILRKYFHGVVVAVYLPGILMDVELLFTASVIALAAFLLLEAVRLYNLEGLGPILNSSMAGFLDEKDQGSLILTHTYLLVGCSLPVWIFPGTTVTNAVEVLLLSSGVIALGIGDAAASIGGSLYGRTKWSGSEKSVEGTAFSVAAELLFVFILQILGNKPNFKVVTQRLTSESYPQVFLARRHQVFRGFGFSSHPLLLR